MYCISANVQFNGTEFLRTTSALHRINLGAFRMSQKTTIKGPIQAIAKQAYMQLWHVAGAIGSTMTVTLIEHIFCKRTNMLIAFYGHACCWASISVKLSVAPTVTTRLHSNCQTSLFWSQVACLSEKQHVKIYALDWIMCVRRFPYYSNKDIILFGLTIAKFELSYQYAGLR